MMKLKKLKVLLFAVAVVLLATTHSFSQSSAAKSWTPFWTKFSKAVMVKNKTIIKSVAASDFSDGGGGDTVTEWMRYTLDRNNLWGLVQKSMKKGTRVYDGGDGNPWRVTTDNHLLFVYRNKRWYFYGVMGD